MTTFENQCVILAELWLDYRYADDFTDFIAYNDLGLPLAYAIDSGIVEPTDKAMNFVQETYDNLLETLGIDEEFDFYSFGDVLAQVNKDK